MDFGSFGGGGDWLSGLFSGRGTSDASERAALRARGEPEVPGGVTLESPTDPISPAEKQMMFPKGLPDEAHMGGLAALAMRSQAPTPPPPPTGSAAAGAAQPGGGVGNWLMTDPEGMAKAMRAQKQSAAISQTAGDAGSIVRMIAMAGA